MSEVKFGNTILEVNNEVVGKVTSFARALTVSEEDVTGSEDVIPGSNVLHQQFVSIAVGETATIEGITMESQAEGPDVGQSELRDAAEAGDIVTITHTKNTGYGQTLTGFFTAYNESGSTTAVYRFTGTFRVNSKVDIVPGS